MMAANALNFRGAANALIPADRFAHEAKALVLAYHDGIVETAGDTVTVLKAVKTASEITLAVGSVVIPGAAVVGTVGSIGMTAGENLGGALMGKKIDWGKFTFDLALGIVLAKLEPGKKLADAVIAKLGGDKTGSHQGTRQVCAC